MKTLHNNFTTPEQSKRLLELGVPADSADCHYKKPDNLTEKWEYQCYIGECIAIKQNLFSYRNGYIIPCWTFGRLMEIFDICNLYELHKFSERRYWSVNINKLIRDYEVAAEENMLDFSRLED